MREKGGLGTGYWVLGTGYWVLGTGYWVLGTGDVSVRYDGNRFFPFSQILSPSNAPYWTDKPKTVH
jgi:hypothetical protein